MYMAWSERSLVLSVHFWSNVLHLYKSLEKAGVLKTELDEPNSYKDAFVIFPLPLTVSQKKARESECSEELTIVMNCTKAYMPSLLVKSSDKMGRSSLIRFKQVWKWEEMLFITN